MAVVGEQQRRSVRLRPGHLPGADRAAGARPVLDDDAALQALAERIHDHAGARVEAAAGGQRHDHADGLLRQVVGLRTRSRKHKHTANEPRRPTHCSSCSPPAPAVPIMPDLPTQREASGAELASCGISMVSGDARGAQRAIPVQEAELCRRQLKQAYSVVLPRSPRQGTNYRQDSLGVPSNTPLPLWERGFDASVLPSPLLQSTRFQHSAASDASRSPTWPDITTTFRTV